MRIEKTRIRIKDIVIESAIKVNFVEENQNNDNKRKRKFSDTTYFSNYGS